MRIVWEPGFVILLADGVEIYRMYASEFYDQFGFQSVSRA